LYDAPEEEEGPKIQKKLGPKNGINRKVPPSVDELLKKKKEADAAKAKPRFMSKAERERLAAEKERQEKQVTQNGSRFEEVRSAPTGPRSMKPGIPTGPASMRNQNYSNGTRAVAKEAPVKDVEKRGASKDVEKDLVKQRYMGPDMSQSNFSALKKRKRTTDKKFNFEWDLEEDTSTDHSPLYQGQIEANFYGRGKLGGFGEAQMEKNALEYRKAVEQGDKTFGSKRAREMEELDKMRREEGKRMALDKHWSQKKLGDMMERDWRIFKEDFQISTKGGSVPNPMRSWEESGLPAKLQEVIDRIGYTEPTPIQRAAIPISLNSRDLIGVAVTGSGKTAAFLLPLLVYISELPPLDDLTKNDGPYSIILAPTRELAQQIEIEARKFATPLGFTCVSIVGGHSIEEQAYKLRDGAEIVIATPGRLIDCLERRLLVLSQCCYIIMDEADRMIDMGFEEPVNKILDALPVANEKPDSDMAENSQAMSRPLGGKDRYRQTMMYTATMPAAVERIARKYLRRPAIVTIGNVGEAVETVEQRVEFVGGEDRRKKRLNEILGSGQFAPPIIVFVNIKRNCDAVARDVRHMGFSSVTLHGSKTQEQREQALGSLRNGTTDVLVATDLAGRGIDVPDVSLVVNFNMAHTIESYTHRIGRTGRAGKSGVAITFLGPEDNDVLYDLKQMLSKSNISKVPEELRKHDAAQSKPTRGIKRADENAAIAAKGGR
jgi:ATP-dependent RNA helicase DDX23/PRP28